MTPVVGPAVNVSLTPHVLDVVTVGATGVTVVVHGSIGLPTSEYLTDWAPVNL